MLRHAPRLVEDVADSADRQDHLLQAAVTLEDLLLRPVVIRNVGPGVVLRTSVFHLMSIIVVVKIIL